jgi:hypothetical protein
MRGSAILAVGVLLLAAVGLQGCSTSDYTYRYKLTLSVQTPDGIKTAFNVVEVDSYDGFYLYRASRTGITGEAVYLDLGPNRPPLIALLTNYSNTFFGERPVGHWFNDRPTNVLGRLYGITRRQYSSSGFVAVVAKQRGTKEIEVVDLPNLVTFTNPADPKTVVAVDSENLSSTLGTGIRWHRMTIEITDDPVTTGLEKKLPWLRGLDTNLVGEKSSAHLSLADQLYRWDFKSGGR